MMDATELPEQLRWLSSYANEQCLTAKSKGRADLAYRAQTVSVACDFLLDALLDFQINNDELDRFWRAIRRAV